MNNRGTLCSHGCVLPRPPFQRTLLFSCKKCSQLTASNCRHLQDLLSFCAEATLFSGSPPPGTTRAGLLGPAPSCPVQDPWKGNLFLGNSLFGFPKIPLDLHCSLRCPLLLPASSSFSFHRCQICTGLRIPSLPSPVSCPLLSLQVLSLHSISLLHV